MSVYKITSKWSIVALPQAVSVWIIWDTVDEDALTPDGPYLATAIASLTHEITANADSILDAEKAADKADKVLEVDFEYGPTRVLVLFPDMGNIDRPPWVERDRVYFSEKAAQDAVNEITAKLKKIGSGA